MGSIPNKVQLEIVTDNGNARRNFDDNAEMEIKVKQGDEVYTIGKLNLVYSKHKKAFLAIGMIGSDVISVMIPFDDIQEIGEGFDAAYGGTG